ncbi:MAG TPA: hypothetical protein VF804_11115 [Holophagaceae bacterium]
MRSRLLVLLLACAMPAAAADGLRYRFQVWMRGGTGPLETRFDLLPAPGTTSHNRVKKPRMSTWRLEAQRNQGTPYAQAVLLARAERLLYLSGPAPQTRREPIFLRFGTRSLPVWSLRLPAGLDASGVMVEVGPGLLALCDLSVRFAQGDVARMELHLESLDGTATLKPAEDGTALLSTLGLWARNPQGEASPAVETVR